MNQSKISYPAIRYLKVLLRQRFKKTRFILVKRPGPVLEMIVGNQVTLIPIPNQTGSFKEYLSHMQEIVNGLPP